jgi:membrane protein YqaA with SNARE-associated domain
MLFSREYHLRFKDSRFYHLILAATAVFLMLTALVPFEAVLLPAVASNPKDWRKITAASVIGSAVGAALLSGVFQYLGLPIVQHLFPDIEQSRAWFTAAQWIGLYGGWAMGLIAALPIAQGPALAVAGLFQIQPWVILLAFLPGKAIRYSIEAFLVAKGEREFLKR